MYNEHYGFSASPFENNLDQRFLYLSEDHREVLAALLYFIKEKKGFALLCGDVGTGKTMLVNCLLTHLPETVTPVIIFNPNVEYEELLQFVAHKLGIDAQKKQVLELVDDVKEGLIKDNEAGRQYVLIIDEAHLLSANNLEQIRLLSNIEIAEQKLLQILLVGQYELSYKLDKHDMRQLRQRISINRFLSTLDMQEVIHYIDHRLQVVGSGYDACFEKNCGKLLFSLTKGSPRLINQVCDNALLIAKSEGRSRVSKRAIKKAEEALRSDRLFTPKSVTFLLKNIGAMWAQSRIATLGGLCVFILALFGLVNFVSDFFRDGNILSGIVRSVGPGQEIVAGTAVDAVAGREGSQAAAPQQAAPVVPSSVAKGGIRTVAKQEQPPPVAGPDNTTTAIDASEMLVARGTASAGTADEVPAVSAQDYYYTIQICALSKSDNEEAKTYSQGLQQKGYPAYVMPLYTRKDKIVYKIRIGRYASVSGAKQAAELFYKAERNEYLIVKSKIPIGPSATSDIRNPEAASMPVRQSGNVDNASGLM